jgi:hypothetical protein
MAMGIEFSAAQKMIGACQGDSGGSGGDVVCATALLCKRFGLIDRIGL